MLPVRVQPAAGRALRIANSELELMAHLLRRAGFGATRAELEQYVAKRYEATVDNLLPPDRAAPLEDADLPPWLTFSPAPFRFGP